MGLPSLLVEYLYLAKTPMLLTRLKHLVTDLGY